MLALDRVFVDLLLAHRANSAVRRGIGPQPATAMLAFDCVLSDFFFAKRTMVWAGNVSVVRGIHDLLLDPEILWIANDQEIDFHAPLQESHGTTCH